MVSGKPTISIMMPCYNANATLPRALASVLAQTFEDSECIVVDDGSDDSPAPIIAQAADPRIRLITLEHNQGRAVARQAALDAARGEYLAMLDADDWMFPSRLSDQLTILKAHPEIALVSSSMAIVDGENEMVGVRPSTRGGQPRFATFRQLSTPPVVHAPSMIRMSDAKQYSYGPKYRRAEDYDFLLKLLLGRPYAVLSQVHYAYLETAEMTLTKLVESTRLGREIGLSHAGRFPIRGRYLAAQFSAKSFAYRLAFRLGIEQRLISQRSSTPSDADLGDFVQARSIVDATRLRVFG